LEESVIKGHNCPLVTGSFFNFAGKGIEMINKLLRMGKVLSLVLTIFLQIYWFKILRKPKEEQEHLWSRIGERFRKTLFELEGVLIKIGQILSSRSDLLPNSFIRQIEDLTDQVPPSDWGEISRILEKEWGGSSEEYFQTIEQSAIASASIGEVYKGILKDGTEVAIKVKRPHIDTIIQTDFRILRIVIWLVDYLAPIPKGFINFKLLFQELKQVIERELNYSKELETLLYFKNRFHDMEFVKIPDVYKELCTSNILVMEWLEGIKINNNGEIDKLPVSRQELAQRLIKVFLPQWLETGLFHADPHQGNVLVSKEGKLILLDFGMIGQISKKDAAYFQGLIESFLAKNYTKAVDCLFHLGFLLPEADTRMIERLLAEFVSFQPAQIKEMDLMALKMEINDFVKALPIQVPTRFVFLGRSFVTVEGIILSLTPQADFIELGKPVFIDWLTKQGNHKWSFVWQWIQSQPIFRFFHSATEFLNMPQKLEQIKETEQRREFQFTIYENYKKHLFQLGIVGLTSTAAGIYTSQTLMWKISLGITVLSIGGYFIYNLKLKNWMKYMNEIRRK
jgi:predicted unusual protein kinase regulating ubiquinone biosynthesis (AarF/ABC1/UbiB family)